tara:strand:- start:69360 stop:69608 length:249 start_codon:yes stop_codon:yes gene_type:complete
MKTKEEILTEYGCPEIPFDENVTMFYPAILEAMEEYTQQQLKILNIPGVSQQRELLKTTRERNAFNDGYSLGCKTTRKKYDK